MDTINSDLYGNIMSYFTSNEVETMKKVSTEMKAYTEKHTRLAKEIKLMEIWGPAVFKIIKVSFTDIDYRSNFNDIYNTISNGKNLLPVLNVVYTYLLKHNYTTSIYIEIHDTLYSRRRDSTSVRDILLHRNDFIRKHFDKLDKDDKSLQNILKITRHIQQVSSTRRYGNFMDFDCVKHGILDIEANELYFTEE